MHLFHGLWRVGQFVAQFGLELLLVMRVRQDVFPVIENLGVRIEQDAVQLAPPGIQPFDGRQEFVRNPIGIPAILKERRDFDDEGLAGP
jgi:hypothetical protein